MKTQIILSILAFLFILTMSACSCGEDFLIEPETDAAVDAKDDGSNPRPDAKTLMPPDATVPDTAIPDSSSDALVVDAQMDAETPDAKVPDAMVDASAPDAMPPAQTCYHPACPWWASIDTITPEKVFLLECHGFDSNVANTVIHLDASTWYGGIGTVTLNGVTDTYAFNVTDGSRHEGASFIYNVYYDNSLTQNEADSMVTQTTFEVILWPAPSNDWALQFSSGGFANSETEGLYLCNSQ